jgi:hypothetical protein
MHVNLAIVEAAESCGGIAGLATLLGVDDIDEDLCDGRPLKNEIKEI